MSMIALHRIKDQVAHYTGVSQCAYKEAVSCANIVWTQRMILSVVLEKEWSCHTMGIYMSSAFDTVRRSTLLELLKQAGCSEDVIRIVRFLLAHTKLSIKVKNTISGHFDVTVGAFQGDGLSGCLFTLYLAGALLQLRAVTSCFRPNPPISNDNLPLEWEYADDTDFMDEDKITLQKLYQICENIFQEWNLKVNNDKTEFTEFYLAQKDQVDEKGEALKGKEEWRENVALGARLCTTADIKYRCNRGNHAFQEGLASRS